jgi:hypothetical protein
MSETTGMWRALGLWMLSISLAFLLGLSGYRLWQGMQEGSEAGVQDGLIMVALYGMCFLAAMFAGLLSRKSTPPRSPR